MKFDKNISKRDCTLLLRIVNQITKNMSINICCIYKRKKTKLFFSILKIYVVQTCVTDNECYHHNSIFELNNF